MKELLLAQNLNKGTNYFLINGISVPTFSYTGPFVDPEKPVVTKIATLAFSTDTANVKVGSVFKVSVNLNSGSNKVKSYKLKLNFPSSLAEVLDYSPSEAGIQVNFTESQLTKKTNTVNNTLGTIEVSADSANAFVINSKVIEINFRAKAAGTIVISQDNLATEGVAEDNGKVTMVTNGISILVSETQMSSSSISSSSISSLSSSRSSSISSSSSSAKAPITGIIDDGLGSVVPVGIALVLMFVGLRNLAASKKIVI